MPAGLLELDAARLYIVDVTPEEYVVPYIASYILDPGAGGPLLVVDPGPSCCVDRVAGLLADLGARRRGVEVYVTHVHIDHAGGVGRLGRLLGWDAVRAVRVHPRGARHLAEPSKLWRASLDYLGEIARLYGEPLPVPEEKLAPTRDGEEHGYDSAVARVVHTPGHASHHQSILLDVAGERILFPGDSAGMVSPVADAVAPTTPPPLYLDLYMESLLRQARLSPSLVAYTHTGPGEPGLLERHRLQVERWLNALAQADPAGVDEALELVRRVDPEVDRFLSSVERVSRLLVEAVRHSVDGFLWYLRSRRGEEGRRA